MNTKVLLFVLTPIMSLLICTGCQRSEPDQTRETRIPAEQADTAPKADPPMPGAIIETSSGLKYQDLERGSGPRPMIGQSLQIYYTGRLKEGGEPFDSGVFNYNPIKDKTIRGWKLGILGDGEVEAMRIGGRRKLIIPPDLGYGSSETGPVPPQSTLIFEIELRKTIE
ncbi:MAG: FKBP-type peptidyl-prolyl cis-trans isomerase [Acidobacteria bacterium]|nr:FKBP-type peptidyl-prolyl cis-trans isomerase [Acidobacteriota bacterium]